MTRGRPCLLAAAGLCVLSFLACKGQADFSDAAPQPVVLNADEYRQEITDIDRLLFEEAPFREERRASAGAKLEQLATRVKAAARSPYLDLEALELRRLAEMARGLPEKAPKAGLQNQWMRIRSNLFDDRSWFARSASDLPPETARAR